MLARSLHTLRRAALPPKPFPRAAAGVPRRCGSRGLVRGPSAGTGTGRSAWVEHDGVVHTVAYPFGATAEDGVGDQTRMALASLDERLAQAGTDKSRIIEATVFLHDMSAFAEMDAVWRAYIPEGCGPSRAAVGVSLGGDVMVEMKVSAAAPAVGLGTTPTTTKAKKKGGPKRGKTSYLLFCQAVRDDVVKANPEASFGAIGKLLGAKWKTLSDADKEPFVRLAADDKARYEAELLLL